MAGLTSSAEAPRYLEAYPRLSVAEAWAVHRRGRPIVLWRNRYHHVVGMAEVRWLDRMNCEADWMIDDLPYLDAGQGTQSIAVTLSNMSHGMQRTMAWCPRCDSGHGHIVYDGEDWSCKNAMRLINRSACLDEVVRVSEKMDEIEGLIQDGRPGGMREKNYLELQRKLVQLNVILAGRPRRSASSDYRHHVTSEWVSDGGFADHLRARLG